MPMIYDFHCVNYIWSRESLINTYPSYSIFVTHLLQFTRETISSFCNIVNTLWCCTYLPLIYKDMFFDIVIWYNIYCLLMFFSELLWREENKITATAETRQSWDPSGKKRDWSTSQECQGRELEEQSSLSECSRNEPGAPTLPGAEPRRCHSASHRGVWHLPWWSWCWHKLTAHKKSIRGELGSAAAVLGELFEGFSWFFSAKNLITLILSGVIGQQCRQPQTCSMTSQLWLPSGSLAHTSEGFTVIAQIFCLFFQISPCKCLF